MDGFVAQSLESMRIENKLRLENNCITLEELDAYRELLIHLGTPQNAPEFNAILARKLELESSPELREIARLNSIDFTEDMLRGEDEEEENRLIVIEEAEEIEEEGLS